MLAELFLIKIVWHVEDPVTVDFEKLVYLFFIFFKLVFFFSILSAFSSFQHLCEQGLKIKSSALAYFFHMMMTFL